VALPLKKEFKYTFFSLIFVLFTLKNPLFQKKLSTICFFALKRFAYRRSALFSPLFYQPFSHRRLARVERGFFDVFGLVF
jgi:hypothetical protein